jgi:hypothetical protein
MFWTKSILVLVVVVMATTTMGNEVDVSRNLESMSFSLGSSMSMLPAIADQGKMSGKKKGTAKKSGKGKVATKPSSKAGTMSRTAGKGLKESKKEKSGQPKMMKKTGSSFKTGIVGTSPPKAGKGKSTKKEETNSL